MARHFGGASEPPKMGLFGSEKTQSLQLAVCLNFTRGPPQIQSRLTPYQGAIPTMFFGIFTYIWLTFYDKYRYCKYTIHGFYGQYSMGNLNILDVVEYP